MQIEKGKWKKNFSEWFNEIISETEILDYRYPLKGCGVWRPYGFKIRKNVLRIIRDLLDETGHDETLFPLLIPDYIFAKEAIHVKGFEEEVYWVTHGGLKELDVKLALRPTSETAIYPMFALWIRSHADFPVKVYQAVSTFRYETKATRPLIRVREITTFKEAHTAHATWEDAEKQVEEGKMVYSKFFQKLGIPYIINKRPEWDKFPGAVYTLAFDTLTMDRKSLQIGTVHNLGQTFAKTFNIEYETEDGGRDYAYQTCYGISERTIAALIAVHGDDRGLKLP
ncbi:MAG: aminoacyl--tRNA ligase-related protein, partial [Candidatus Helarchaeota archaeon]